MLKASAQRPKPETNPAMKASAAMAASNRAAWLSRRRTIAVAQRARPKPTAIVAALLRKGAGKSLILAPIAPSVAGWPAAKPNRIEARTETTATPAATLRPLTICRPTSNFSTAGERGQARIMAAALFLRRLAKNIRRTRPARASTRFQASARTFPGFPIRAEDGCAKPAPTLAKKRLRRGGRRRFVKQDALLA